MDVVVDTSTNLKQRVKDGQIDLTLVTTNPDGKQPKGMEVIHREKLVWAAPKRLAYEQNPLPISVWEEGCSWRQAAIKSLKNINREFRVAYMSEHIAGQRAAIAPISPSLRYPSPRATTTSSNWAKNTACPRR